MNTIALDKEEVVKAIKLGDNAQGGRYLAVSPDGNCYKILWADTNRPWNPWPTDWMAIGIPALFPEGSGAEGDLAHELLRDQWDGWTYERQLDAGEDIGVVEYAERTYPTEWAEYIQTSAEWLAKAFLAACNGDGADLRELSPWGYTTTEEGRNIDIDPPAQFEWNTAC